MPLQDTLKIIANEWVEVQQSAGSLATLQTLSSRATSDAKLFRRMENGRPMLVTTFEKTLTFLADANNWPNRNVSERATSLLRHLSPVVGFSAQTNSPPGRSQ